MALPLSLIREPRLLILNLTPLQICQRNICPWSVFLYPPRHTLLRQEDQTCTANSIHLPLSDLWPQPHIYREIRHLQLTPPGTNSTYPCQLLLFLLHMLGQFSWHILDSHHQLYPCPSPEYHPSPDKDIRPTWQPIQPCDSPEIHMPNPQLCAKSPSPFLLLLQARMIDWHHQIHQHKLLNKKMSRTRPPHS